MNINKNCSTFNFMFRVPNAQVGEVEKVLASDKAWMRETHRGPSDPNHLVYTLTKGSEFNNPLDPSEWTTGYTLMALTEICNGQEGCQAHLDGVDGWKDFPDMLEKVVPHQVGMMMFGEVIGSMDD